MKRFVGSLITHDKAKHCGFIGLKSVAAQNGSPHGLSTTKDIFVHQQDCSSPLRGGLELSFEVQPDDRRGGDALRAVDVTEVVAGELVLVGAEAGASRALTDPQSLYVPPTPAQRVGMKHIEPKVVEQVLVNRPLAMVPRSFHKTEYSAAELVNELMRRVFPQFDAIDGSADMAKESFDEVIKKAVADHKLLGMHAQADVMQSQAKVYRGLRSLLQSEEDLLKPETIIPIRYLPDLFAAVPVWYFWADDETRMQADRLRTENNPYIPAKLQYFCDLFVGRRWTDTFLMFNRRLRTLGDYTGDIVPPKISARMRKMAGLFDHLVIMTPYHDVVGKEWDKVQWERSVDPYVVGFVRGVPIAFVIGRFSDSGVFPLYSELVGDTINFLRTNSSKMLNFDRIDNARWYKTDSWNTTTQAGLGTYLSKHTKELLKAFDEGKLFDWLRGEDTKLPVRS